MYSLTSVDDSIDEFANQCSKLYSVENEIKELKKLNDQKECKSSNSPINKKKRNKEFKNWPTDYRKGENIDDLKIDNECIEKYNRLKSLLTVCGSCKRNVSIIDSFKVNNCFMCIDCAKNNKIHLNELKNDFYEHLELFKGLEAFNFKNEKLYQCNRLNHSKPSYYFIHYSKKSKQYNKRTNCLFCRNYKAQENHLMKK